MTEPAGPAPGLPATGSPAPGFTLRDQHGVDVSLADFRGRPVLLVFYPFAFSGICSTELAEIRDTPDVFTAGGLQVVAVSCDPMFSLRAFADAQGLDFPLLSDFWPHGAVSGTYGVFDPAAGRPGRGSFLIDPRGVLRWSVLHDPGQARPLAAYREAIAAL